MNASAAALATRAVLRQRAIEGGPAFTIAELAAARGVTPATIRRHLRMLVAAGSIRLVPAGVHVEFLTARPDHPTPAQGDAGGGITRPLEPTAWAVSKAAS